MEISGKRLSDLYLTAESGSACRGAVEFKESVPDGVAPMRGLTGWGWDDTRNRTPERVLIVSGGYIQGLGHSPDKGPSAGQRLAISAWRHRAGSGTCIRSG